MKNPTASKRPVSLITGGAVRLGRQIALAFAEKGFDVVIAFGQSRASALKTVREIRAKGVRAMAIHADVTKPKQVESLVRRALREYTRIDVLVNNAAVFVSSPFLKTSEQTWDRVIDTNLKGVFTTSQRVSKAMLRQKKGGRIINIASLGGLQAWSEHVPYSVSKAGVVMLTRCMAKALAPRISVNAIAPGTIIIPGEERGGARHIPRQRILLGRYGKPSDVTDLVLFLATSSEYITGQTIVVDGGRYV